MTTPETELEARVKELEREVSQLKNRTFRYPTVEEMIEIKRRAEEQGFPLGPVNDQGPVRKRKEGN